VQNRKNKIKGDIMSVFAKVHYPGDDQLVSHDCWECAEVAARFKDHHWQNFKDQPLALLGEEDAYMALLSPKTLHFLISLFLLACLNFNDKSASIPIFTLISNPTHPRYGFPLDKKLHERLTAIKRPQQTKVLTLLRYCNLRSKVSMRGYQLNEKLSYLLNENCAI
jgi:hypothetical protein